MVEVTNSWGNEQSVAYTEIRGLLQKSPCAAFMLQRTFYLVVMFADLVAVISQNESAIPLATSDHARQTRLRIASGC